MTYAIAVLSTLVVTFTLWKVIGRWERYRLHRRDYASCPLIAHKIEQSKELSRLTAQVDVGQQSLIAESKLAPTRVA